MGGFNTAIGGGGGISSFTDQTANRAIGTTYQNNTGNYLFVQFCVVGKPGSTTGDRNDIWAEISPDGTNWYVVSGSPQCCTTTTISYHFGGSFIVPPGWYYRVREYTYAYTNTLEGWYEAEITAAST